MKPKVLFFFNDLNCTGAEILLFNFIKELNRRQSVEIGIVALKEGGELVSQVPSNIPVFYFDQTFDLKDKLVFRIGKNILRSRLDKIYKKFPADYFYFNTINHVSLIKYSKEFPIRMILHVHELLYNFEFEKAEDIRLIFSKIDHLVCSSSLVGNIFESIFSKKITVINSVISELDFNQDIPKVDNAKIRVIASGTICFNKGADIFLEIAQLLPKDRFEFIWLGKFLDSGFSEIIKLKNQVGNWVQFKKANSTDEYKSILQSADIFVSSSRSESMGMVMMEAITLGIPVVATNSGGSELIINDENGIISYDNRPSTLAEIIQKLSEKTPQKLSKKLPFSFLEEYEKFEKIFFFDKHEE